jgi:hypothetical protein
MECGSSIRNSRYDAEEVDREMTTLDAPSSSAPQRATAPKSSQSAVPQGRKQTTSAISSPPSSMSGLDSTDRRILTLERGAPGPHADAIGISPAAYMRRLRRLLYNREANDLAPHTLARLRAELCSGPGTWPTD